eukprot:COSAG06_NODE_68367_length_229_cov_127.592308_1_plen_70_part_10
MQGAEPEPEPEPELGGENVKILKPQVVQGELVRGEMDEMRGEMRALRADNSELSRRLGSLERVESEWNRT